MEGQGVEKAPEAFRTISEVADDLDIPQHVLRFWESRFAQIKPMKRGGGRRYYRPDDVALLRGIRHLLYGQGYTIRGVQRILREQGVRFVQEVWQEGAEQPIPSVADAPAQAAVDTDDETVSSHGSVGAPERIDEPPASAPYDERREPSFAAPPRGAAAAAHRPVAGLSPGERQALQAALAELAECRRLLDAALDEAG